VVPGSIEQAHKIDEFIVLDELKKMFKSSRRYKNKIYYELKKAHHIK